ncbi:MAG: methyltransferase domain-containing protein [Deltaproteobacteria bacterium]|nr:methyltransferase domain-containing protein [Deltaproteobacteria bacterium]
MFGLSRRRNRIAEQYLAGNGIEIGALQNPLKVPTGVQVTYVDRMGNADLFKHYPELSGHKLVPVDVIDDGEILATIDRSSQDFIIANHFLEHCQNPIGALAVWAQRLKPRGTAYIAIPDMRFSFDHRRPPTPWAHLLDDYNGETNQSRHAHYREWTRLVLGVPELQVDAVAEDLMNRDYSIHFHTWTATSFREFLSNCTKDLGFPLGLRAFIRNGGEIIAILIKK